MGNNFISNSVLIVTKYFATGPTSLFLTMKKIEDIYYVNMDLCSFHSFGLRVANQQP